MERHICQHLQTFTAEFAYQMPLSAGVYSLQMGSMCPECGLSRTVVSQSILNQLRAALEIERCSAGSQTGSLNCKCQDRGAFSFFAAVTFGRGLRPPVAVMEPVKVLVCMGCGMSEFTVAADALTELQGIKPTPATARRHLFKTA